MAGLARMANRDHRFVEIQPGDTVIVSASPIPGNEEYVARTIDNLFKAGANVFYHTIKRAHVSGHASQEELKLMLGLTKPKHFIPIHGEFRMQVQHGRLAIETGVAAGERLHHRERHADRDLRRRLGPARQPGAGGLRLRRRPVRRRGRRRHPPRSARPRERRDVHGRRHTSTSRPATVVGRPEIITRGFVHGNEQDRIIAEAITLLGSRSSNPGDRISEVALLKVQIKDSVSRYLYEQTKRRPMVFPVVVEV